VSCNYCAQAEVDPKFGMYDMGCYHCTARRQAIKLLAGKTNWETIGLVLEGYFGEKKAEALGEVKHWLQRLV
jgi:hypothetical protein